MEDRLNRGYKGGNSSSKSKSYTKEELLERKRELLKKARQNVQHLLQSQKCEDDDSCVFKMSEENDLPRSLTKASSSTKVVKLDFVTQKSSFDSRHLKNFSIDSSKPKVAPPP